MKTEAPTIIVTPWTDAKVKLWEEAVKRWTWRSNCEKKRVAAIIVSPWDGCVIGRGVNGPQLPILGKCPRLKVKTGERYDLCQSTCGSAIHAEVAALQDAYSRHPDVPRPVDGTVMFVAGHDYICEACRIVAEKCGIDGMYLVGGEDG